MEQTEHTKLHHEILAALERLNDAIAVLSSNQKKLASAQGQIIDRLLDLRANGEGRDEDLQKIVDLLGEEVPLGIEARRSTPFDDLVGGLRLLD